MVCWIQGIHWAPGSSKPSASSTCGLGINAMGSATARGAVDFVGVAALAGCGPMLIHQHAGTPIMAEYQGRCKGVVLDSQFPSRNLLIPSHLSLYLWLYIDGGVHKRSPKCHSAGEILTRKKRPTSWIGTIWLCPHYRCYIIIPNRLATVVEVRFHVRKFLGTKIRKVRREPRNCRGNKHSLGE